MKTSTLNDVVKLAIPLAFLAATMKFLCFYTFLGINIFSICTITDLLLNVIPDIIFILLISVPGGILGYRIGVLEAKRADSTFRDVERSKEPNQRTIHPYEISLPWVCGFFGLLSVTLWLECYLNWPYAVVFVTFIMQWGIIIVLAYLQIEHRVADTFEIDISLRIQMSVLFTFCLLMSLLGLCEGVAIKYSEYYHPVTKAQFRDKKIITGPSLRYVAMFERFVLFYDKGKDSYCLYPTSDLTFIEHTY